MSKWDAWRPEEVARRLTGVDAPWYVAAGWAIDLFLGGQRREHEAVVRQLEGLVTNTMRSIQALEGKLTADEQGRFRAFGVTPYAPVRVALDSTRIALLRSAPAGEHDTGWFAAAVEECKQHFKHCTRCGHWVCPEACFNHKAGLCEDCAPDFESERAAAQAQAAREQVWQKASQTDQTGGMDLSAPRAAACPHCGKKGGGGKFCAECGKPLSAKVAV